MRSEDQKIVAVRAVESGEPSTQVAKRMRVSTETLRGWRKRYGASAVRVTGRTRTTVQTTSLNELQAENRALRECLGTMFFQAWRRGDLVGSDILETISQLRPQATAGLNQPNISQHIPSHSNANGSAALPS
jgi:hypothetical protein